MVTGTVKSLWGGCSREPNNPPRPRPLLLAKKCCGPRGPQEERPHPPTPAPVWGLFGLWWWLQGHVQAWAGSGPGCFGQRCQQTRVLISRMIPTREPGFLHVSQKTFTPHCTATLRLLSPPGPNPPAKAKFASLFPVPFDNGFLGTPTSVFIF